MVQASAQCDTIVKKYVYNHYYKTWNWNGKPLVVKSMELKSDTLYSIPDMLYIVSIPGLVSSSELEQYLSKKLEGIEYFCTPSRSKYKADQMGLGLAYLKFHQGKAVVDAHNALMEDDSIMNVRNIYCRRNPSLEPLNYLSNLEKEDNDFANYSYVPFDVLFCTYDKKGMSQLYITNLDDVAIDLDSLIDMFKVFPQWVELSYGKEYYFFVTKQFEMKQAENVFLNFEKDIFYGPYFESLEKPYIPVIYDDPTSISESQAKPDSGSHYYTLSGREIMTYPKEQGLYIKDGKKILISH